MTLSAIKALELRESKIFRLDFKKFKKLLKTAIPYQARPTKNLSNSIWTGWLIKMTESALKVFETQKIGKMITKSAAPYPSSTMQTLLVE